MKFAIVFLAIVGIAFAAPIDDSRHAEILKYDNNNIGVDGYNFAFETSDGTSRQEQGELRDAGGEVPSIAVRGTISYVAPDGQLITLNYIADENGFRPEGAHLPKA